MTLLQSAMAFTIASTQAASDAVESPYWRDGLTLVAIMTGSVVVVAAALWLAQCLAVDRYFLSSDANPSPVRYDSSPRFARMLLGIVAVAGSLAMMLGVIPGTSLMEPVHAMACLATAFLGMVTIVSAVKTRAAILAQGETNWTMGDKTQSRRAA
jgi:peptidoglycan/LPS O-acetylase OafA/YrhL